MCRLVFFFVIQRHTTKAYEGKRFLDAVLSIAITKVMLVGRGLYIGSASQTNLRYILTFKVFTTVLKLMVLALKMYMSSHGRIFCDTRWTLVSISIIHIRFRVKTEIYVTRIKREH